MTSETCKERCEGEKSGGNKTELLDLSTKG